jgi:hypothetical protein
VRSVALCWLSGVAVAVGAGFTHLGAGVVLCSPRERDGHGRVGGVGLDDVGTEALATRSTAMRHRIRILSSLRSEACAPYIHPLTQPAKPSFMVMASTFTTLQRHSHLLQPRPPRPFTV